MGLLDRLKTNRHADDGASGRAPTNFDELQAAESGEAPSATAIDSRDAELDQPTVDASLTATPSAASIISELPPSGELSDFTESRLMPAGAAAAAALAAPATRLLPFIGHRPVAAQQRMLGAVAVVGLVGLVAVTLLALTSANRSATQVGATGQALMQSQRLAKAVSQAMAGTATSFAEIQEASTVLAANTRQLKDGGPALAAAPAGAQPLLLSMMPLVDRAEKNANAILAQQKTLVQVGQALKTINTQAAEWQRTVPTMGGQLSLCRE